MRYTLSEADLAFRAAFEAARVEPRDFDHRAHVRLAYAYLADGPTDAAASRMRTALIAFLERRSLDPSKYHETLTRAWILAVRHFMETSPGAASADAFLDANGALLDPTIMFRHYSSSRLFSERARAEFVEPDLAPIPSYGS